MTSGRVLRRTVAIGLLALLIASSLGLPAASAAGGTWGVTGATYVDGVVCTDGPITSPLASWNFGDDSDEFLLSSVTSNGVTDSAALPYQGVNGRTVTPVSPGQFGLDSTSDVSTYAALVSHFGAGSGGAPAIVARAVLDRSDPGSEPDCVSTAQTQPYLAKAAALAGPYQLTVTAGTTPATLGAANSVNVAVTNTLGTPVVGASVSITATAPVFGSSSTSTAVTGSDGIAHAPFTIGAVGTLAAVTFTATASVSVGLEAATVSAFSGVTQYVGALYADPPTSYTANLALPIRQSAQPAITAQVPSTAIVQGAAFTLGDSVTGLFGHSAHLQFTVLGPVPLNPTTLCSKLPANSWTTATPTAATGTVDTTSDAVVDAGTWTPSKIGCYRLSSTATTTDATPQATAQARPVVLTVINTTATLAGSHSVFPVGPITQSVTVTNSYAQAGTISTQVLGPLTPGDGDCSGVNWATAKRHAGGSVKTSGDGTFAVSATSLTKPGCYQLRASMALSIPGSSPAVVPLTDTTGDGVLYVLAPTVSASAEVTSVASPASVATRVSVLDTYGQAGTVQLQMYQSAATAFGCRDFHLAGATLLSSGPSTPFTGDGTITVRSGATPSLGCYALVPKLVMTGNSAIVATGTVGYDNIVLAGLGNVGPPPRPATAGPESWVAQIVVLSVFVVLLMAGCAGVFWFFVKVYREESDDSLGGLDLALGL